MNGLSDLLRALDNESIPDYLNISGNPSWYGDLRKGRSFYQILLEKHEVGGINCGRIKIHFQRQEWTPSLEPLKGKWWKEKEQTDRMRLLSEYKVDQLLSVAKNDFIERIIERFHNSYEVIELRIPYTKEMKSQIIELSKAYYLKLKLEDVVIDDTK